MNQIKSPHPTADQLRSYGLGQLEPDELAAVEQHVAQCDSCCESLGAFGDDTLLAGLKNCDTSIPETIDSTRFQKRSQRGVGSGIPEELAEHPRYRVVEELGKGGMGVVYKAEHRLMQRPVALKVINHKLVENETAIERFRLEVRAAAQLAHPNIVTAHDAEQAGNIHFLVMEYVEGIDLAKQVKKGGPLPVRHACHFARQVASGLQQAFSKGMVHRDIKPQNVMLTSEGRVKILDFGLARLASEADVDSEAAKLTKDGVMLGTPDYMAPEQILDSRQADIRADIYSLGCTLYFLLTGHPPFPNGSPVDKMTAQLKQTPPAIKRDDVPSELTTIIDRMMAKKVEDRFQTPQQVVDALQPFCKSTASTSQPTVAAPPKPLAPQADPLAAPLPAAAALPTSPYGTQSRNRQPDLLARYRTPLIAGASVLLIAMVCLVAAGPVRRALTAQADSPPARPDKVSHSDAPDDATPASTVGTSATARPNIAIVVPRNQLYWPDYQRVADTFRDHAHVIVASSRTGTITDHTGNHSLPVKHTLEQLDASNLDAIVFTGAMDPHINLEFLRQGDYFAETRQLIQAMQREGKCVASLCVGNAVLEHHGVLTGKQAAWTTWMTDNNKSLFPSANWKDRPDVYSEGRVITATSADEAPQFVEAILAELAK